MLRKLFFVFMAVSLSVPTLISKSSFAAESTTDKIKDDYGDAKTDTKKMVRHTNQNVRKATGNDNAFKDAKDKGNDAGDDISNGANKLKRKAQSN